MFYGSVNIKLNQDILQKDCPHIVVGTPGRAFGLAREQTLKVDHIKRFVLDEFDQTLEALDMC